MTDVAPPTVAAIDCGSNSTRLLVVDAHGTTLVRLMRITRLAQGVDADRKLDGDAVERTIRVLTEYRRVMDAHGVVRVRAVATSAVRDADNGREFLDAAAWVVRVPVELLAGDEEGRLAYVGATADLPRVAGDDVVVDIGGGSTELIVRRHDLLQVVSLDLGCVRLTERHLHHDPPGPQELSETSATIAAGLDRAERSVPLLAELRPASRLTGLAGTVSTLSMLDQKLADYDRDRVHHSVLLRSVVERWCDTLASEPAAARGKRPGMVPGREDVILGGALVLRDVMRRCDFTECLVSESDILDGLVTSLRS